MRTPETPKAQVLSAELSRADIVMHLAFLVLLAGAAFLAGPGASFMPRNPLPIYLGLDLVLLSAATYLTHHCYMKFGPLMAWAWGGLSLCLYTVVVLHAATLTV